MPKILTQELLSMTVKFKFDNSAFIIFENNDSQLEIDEGYKKNILLVFYFYVYAYV